MGCTRTAQRVQNLVHAHDWLPSIGCHLRDDAGEVVSVRVEQRDRKADDLSGKTRRRAIAG